MLAYYAMLKNVIIMLVCCIIPPARLEHARALHILDYTAPAPMSTSLL